MRFEEVHPTETTVLAFLVDAWHRATAFVEESRCDVSEVDTRRPSIVLLVTTVALAAAERLVRRRLVRSLLRDQRL